MAGIKGRSGRQHGATSLKTRRIAEGCISDGGITPLEYMIKVMRNEKAPTARRDEMAKSAAPYIHPKLSAIDVGNKGNEPFVVQIVRFSEEV